MFEIILIKFSDSNNLNKYIIPYLPWVKLRNILSNI